jgi:glutamate--cysteine ligase
MKQFFTVKNIKNILTNTEILSGNFGFEKEGLRINSKGELALTPHPQVFGNKLTNPFITTDFSESQVEIVTPTFRTVEKAYQCLSFLVDIVNTSIPEDEYIWNQSMPCILPEEKNIPLAEFEGKKGEESRNYRIKLAKNMEPKNR